MADEVIPVHLRWMIRRDLPEVLTIEKASFRDCWNEEDFLTALRQRNVIGIVAEFGEIVAGYAIYQLSKSSIEILNLAVLPDARRLHVGSQLVWKLVGKLSTQRRTSLTACVRDSNLGAHLFFKANKFQATKVHRRYYRDSGEDAYELEYSVSEPSPFEFQSPRNRIASFVRSDPPHGGQR
jgi:ribosomal-protein-alanine N-acetyltransferase